MDRAKLFVVVLVVALAAGATVAPPAAADALGDAVDNTRLTFFTYGDNYWVATAADSVSGGDSAQSGAIPFGGHSILQTTVTGPGELAFWWKTAASAGDTLLLSVDGMPLYVLPSPVAWSHLTDVGVAAGAHVVTWDFTDDSVMGTGAARVDLVEFNAQPTLSWTGAAGYVSDGLEPESGLPSATFAYRVKYTDVDGGAPTGGAPLLSIKDAGIDIAGSPFRMSLVSGDPATGAIYGYTKSGLPASHTYTYAFAAVDAGGIPASGPPTTPTGGPLVNTPPTLAFTGATGYTVDGVEPDGGLPAASFTYRVKYTDVDGDAPAAGYPKLTVYKGNGGVFLPGSPFTMSYVSGSYATGAIYEYSMGGLAAHGDYAYRFDVQDANGSAAGRPGDGSMYRGPIVNTPPVLEWEGGPGYTADGVEPNTDDTSGTFYFRVKFVDADYDPPDQVDTGGDDVWLHIRKAGVPISGSPFQMQFSHIDGSGAFYYTYAKSGLAAGYDYTYRFTATDRPRSYEGDVGAAATGAPTSWAGGPGVDANAYPTLAWTGEPGYAAAGCAPAAGKPSATFDYRVTYADGDGEAPAAGWPKIHVLRAGAEISGSPFTMTYVSGTPAAGSIYHYATSALAADADYTYRFEAQDARGAPASGAPTSPASGPVVDGTAPTTTATGLRPNTTSGWRNRSQSVGLSAVDTGGAGVASTTYRVDGGVPTAYGGAFEVSGTGNHVVTYSSTDAAGNVEPTKTGYVNIDMITPVTTATGLQPDGTTGWRNAAQRVSLDPHDGGGSGLDVLLYRVDDGELLKYEGEFDIGGPGVHTVTYSASDRAGNVEPEQTGYVNIDVEAPRVSATGLAERPDGGWVSGSTTLTLEGTDSGGAGVVGLVYSVDGGKWFEYVEPVELTAAEGSHLVEYLAEDGAGNASAVGSGYLNVDATPPRTSAGGLQDDATSGWRTTSQSVRLEAQDTGGSGVSAVYWGVDGGGFKLYQGEFEISGEGSHPVAYYATDAAGNAEATHTGYVNIDTTPPVTKDDAPGSWQWTAVTVHLSARDGAGAGVATTEYSTDGGATWTVGIAVTYRIWKRGGGSGVHTLLYRSTDAAGNLEQAKSREVLMDARAPRTTDDAPLTPQTGNVTVHLAAADSLFGVTACSGVKETWYRVDVGGWIQGTQVTIPAAGNAGLHWIAYYSLDNAGNAEYVRWCPVTIAVP